MLDYLVHFVGRLGHWGYLVVFLVAALESAAFIGLIIPGESVVLVAGFLAAQGQFDLDVVILVIAVGAILGDSIGYEMGKRMGRPVLVEHGSRFGLTEARVDKADAFFKKHGGKAVFLGRFVGFARALVPFIAGSSHMRYRQFLPYNVLGAAIWSPAIVLLGYFLGASWHSAQRWIGLASAILAGVVAFVAALVWCWRIIVRHESAIKQKWGRFFERPGVHAFRKRFAPQIAFVRARLSPHGYLGLRLTVGALLMIGASWLFGGVAEDIVSGDPLTVVDAQIAQWLHAHGTSAITQSMLVVSSLHGPIAMSIYFVIFLGFLIWKRLWYWVLTAVLVVPGGMLINVIMKQAFQRTRPTLDHPLLVLLSYSFPSGHVAGSTLFYGVLASLLMTQIAAWTHRVWIALTAFGMIVLVAFSRMYLGVHYLSDVLAAFAEGSAWLALCLTGVQTLHGNRTANGFGAVRD